MRCVNWWAKKTSIGIAHGEQERLQLALKVLREGGIYTPALREIESYDAVLVLGEDVTQTGCASRWQCVRL